MTASTRLDTPAPDETEAISVYEAIGGRPALVAAVDGFFERLLADPALRPFFPDGVALPHRRYVATILGEALGGRERYRGPDLAGAHRGLRISDAHFDRAAGHLDATLDGLGVPRHLTDHIVGVVAGLRPAATRPRARRPCGSRRGGWMPGGDPTRPSWSAAPTWPRTRTTFVWCGA